MIFDTSHWMERPAGTNDGAACCPTDKSVGLRLCLHVANIPYFRYSCIKVRNPSFRCKHVTLPHSTIIHNIPCVFMVCSMYFLCISYISLLQHLHNHPDSITAADAKRAESTLFVLVFEGIQQGGQNFTASCRDGMPQGNCTATDV